MKKVDMYTDGACSYNPGPGGYGIVLIYNGVEKQFSGFDENTTNNRMEITAVIEGLKKLKEPCEVTIYTDSAYTMNAFDLGWLDDWQLNNWKNKQKKDVLNKDLWQELLLQMSKHKITWVKVKGRSDNKYNNICDKLARAEIDKFLKQKKAD
mgnify:FL=1